MGDRAKRRAGPICWRSRLSYAELENLSWSSVCMRFMARHSSELHGRGKPKGIARHDNGGRSPRPLFSARVRRSGA